MGDRFQEKKSGNLRGEFGIVAIVVVVVVLWDIVRDDVKGYTERQSNEVG